jgi:hypothetical protein
MKPVWKRIFVIGLILVATTLLTAQLVFAVPVETDVVAVSATEAGVTDDGVEYDAYDIVARETTYTVTTSSATSYWYILFNGETFGLGTKHVIDAFSINAEEEVGSACGLYCVDAIYMSFKQDAIPVPGIMGKVQGEDIVAFEPGGSGDTSVNTVVTGTFSLYFDGSDVGLTTRAEKIDGLDVWNVSIVDVQFPEDCSAGILFISTQGAYRVPAANGGSLVGDGSDVLIFCATNLGSDTDGFWFRGFDASDEGWPGANKNSLYGLDVSGFFTIDEQEEDEAAELGFHFVVKNTLNVPSAFGGPSEIFGFSDCGGDVFGPIDDLNETWPALNGTVAGFDEPDPSSGTTCVN